MPNREPVKVVVTDYQEAKETEHGVVLGMTEEQAMETAAQMMKLVANQWAESHEEGGASNLDLVQEMKKQVVQATEDLYYYDGYGY